MAGADTPVAASGVISRRRHAGRAADWVGTPRPRQRAGLSIYSILLIMLLSVSVLSSIVVGIIGYINGTEALRAIAYEKLVEIRENRAREVTQLFTTIENAVRLGAMNETSKQAARAFTAGFAELRAAAARSRGIRRASTATTATRSPPICPTATGEDVDGAAFAPRDAAQRSTCSTNYVIPYDDVGRGDPDRRRRRRQRVVGGAREVPRLLPGDDASCRTSRTS